MIRRRQIIAVAVAGLGFISVASAQDATPASDTRINAAIQNISGQVASTEAMKDSALRNGAAVKASCMEEKARRLRATLTTAKNIRETWATASQNPAYAQRTMERMELLEASATTASEEARACSEARDLKFELEVIVPRNLPDAPPGWGIQTPPTFERPPLASPY